MITLNCSRCREYLIVFFLVLTIGSLVGCTSESTHSAIESLENANQQRVQSTSTGVALPTKEIANSTTPFTAAPASPSPTRQTPSHTPSMISPSPSATPSPIPPTATHHPTPAPEARQTALARIERYCLLNRESGGESYALDYYAFYPEPSPKLISLFSVSVHPSCNFPYNRNNQPRAIVLHYTLGSWQGALASWRSGYATPGTSAHYIVTKTGEIIQVIPENRSANHVVMEYDTLETCKFPPLCGKDVPVQELSIGIELENYGPLIKTETGFFSKYGQSIGYQPFHFEQFGDKGTPYVYEWWDPYPAEQLRALHYLIWDIAERWQIKIPDMVLGHSQIQSRVDPGPALEQFIQQQMPTPPESYYPQNP